MSNLVKSGRMMPLRLMLLRHAKSDWPAGVDDHDRPLARRGREASQLMGRYMAAEGLLPDLAIISTACRTQETWDIARSVFPRDIARRDEPRIYEASWQAILRVIKETELQVGGLLVVGHNPGFQELALKLAGTDPQSDLSRLQRKYPTGGLAVIDFDIGDWNDAADGLGRLDRFVTPKSVAGSVPRRS